DYMATATAFSASYVTGQVVAMYDVSQVLNTEFVYIEGGVAVLIFLLLFFVMGSYLTPLRAVLTILTSVVWTLGMTYVVFGMWLGMEITWIMPIILFVICLGLGMDYDILLTTRIRENVMKGMSNDDAIEHAVERSGAVITICGLIMSGAFGTMMLSTSPMLMEFGFALSFAILVDALFMRTYVVPAVMHLLGRYNWSGPARLRTRTFENNDRA
ncbi:MAG: MMPL family transporter, partial [Thermoplasmatales archaeon]|nr:MMPL family transporter [Thermoplasmatales archaeon]